MDDHEVYERIKSNPVLWSFARWLSGVYLVDMRPTWRPWRIPDIVDPSGWYSMEWQDPVTRVSWKRKYGSVSRYVGVLVEVGLLEVIYENPHVGKYYTDKGLGAFLARMGGE
jgi:hypothetical protein